jgi:ubiquinone/menaquinone biosynthesis C-methylase UbiE
VTRSARQDYLPALRFRSLTGIYDPLISATTRERATKGRLVELAGLADGQRVLDVGCGTGTLALMAKAVAPGAELVGIDADEEMLARARTKPGAGAIRFDQGMADELPYEDASFDRVLSSLVFHHLRRPVKERAAREIARVLKPGGRFHLGDFGPPRDPLMWLASRSVRYGDGSSTIDNFAGELPAILREAGLSCDGESERMRTGFGAFCFYVAERPGSPSSSS